MNKKLIAIAIGAALGTLPLASQAGVKVYGHAQVEVADEDYDQNSSDFESINSKKWQKDRTVEDNARGRFGIKASEKLGNGMTAFAQFEWKVDTTGVAGDSTKKVCTDAGCTDSKKVKVATKETITNRVMQVGLKGSWGTFMAGSLKSPYKYTGGVKYDPFVTTNAEARRNGGMVGGVYGANGFMDNTIGYMTPKVNGFQGWIVYSPDENGNKNGDDGDWAASLKFSAGNWEVFVAGVNNECNATTKKVAGCDVGGADYSAWKIGGKVKFGNFTVLGQYEDWEDMNQTKGEDGRLFFVGVHFKSGNNLFVVQASDGKQDDPSGSNDMEWNYYTLGVIHKFSKTARVFAAWSKTDYDNLGHTAADDGDRSVVTVGLRKDFSS